MNQISIASNLDEIKKILPQWKKLYSQSEQKSIYMDPQFFVNMIPFRGVGEQIEPRVILISSQSEPVAIIAGKYTNYKVPLKIGYSKIYMPSQKCFEIEIGGILIANSQKANQLVVEYLNNLLDKEEIDMLMIHHQLFSSSLWESLTSGLDKTKKVTYSKGIEWIANIRNPETNEKIVKHKSKTRATFRKKDRFLLEHFNQKVEVTTFTAPEDIKKFIEDAANIGAKSYQAAIGVGVQNNEHWYQEMLKLAEEKMFRGYILYANSKPISYVVGPVLHGTFYLYATAFDPKFRKISPGSFLLRKVIDFLVTEKTNDIHFGYGDADYKKVYGTHSQEEATICIYSNKTIPKIIYTLDSFN